MTFLYTVVYTKNIKWFKKLKDKIGKAIITDRINRLEEGNPGDIDPVGDDIIEMRIHFGQVTGFIIKSSGRK